MADKDKGMDKALIKKLLIVSKTEPVNCAVAQAEEPGLAVLELHKSKPPRALERALKEDYPTSKNHRFGTAFVDVDENPKLVKFFLNKPVSGMARRLVKTLKGTGFSKVVILLEDGTEVENVEEADELTPTAPGAPSGVAPEIGQAAAPSGPPTPPEPPPPAANPAETAAKLKELQQLLAQLAPQIPKTAGEDATRKAELMKLATDANVNLKTGNLVCAATYLAQLKAAIETPAAGATTFAKSRLIWVATRQKVEQELNKLAAELGKTYAEEPIATQVKTAYQSKAADVLRRVDDKLLDALDAMLENSEPSKRDALVAEARNAAKDLLGVIDSDPLIDALDDNPFVSLALHKTLTASLNGIASSLR